jgi:hypothetical protein
MGVELSTAQLEGLLRRMHLLEEIAERQRSKLEEQHVLLVSALHELAVALGEQPRSFYIKWYSARRRVL